MCQIPEIIISLNLLKFFKFFFNALILQILFNPRRASKNPEKNIQILVANPSLHTFRPTICFCSCGRLNQIVDLRFG